jgi:RNA polymerase sigma factor (sigma-70 family)
VCTGTPGPPPSVGPFVRLTRDASAHPANAGAAPGAPVCDPEGVSEPVLRPEASEPDVVWVAPTWEQVVRDHSARVYRLAYRLSGNAQDAEDLTQETFVRVFRSLADFSPGTFEGWLHRITTNLFLDMVRRRARIRFDALPEDTERLPGTSPSPEQVYADTHLDPQIQAALDALSPEFRVAVVLCDIEGLTYEEIAATLGIKLGTVRSRIHRGRVQLRQALAHLAPRRPAEAGGAPA